VGSGLSWAGLTGMIDEDDTDLPDGFIRENDPEKVRQEPYPILDSFEWVTMDLTDDVQVSRKIIIDMHKLQGTESGDWMGGRWRRYTLFYADITLKTTMRLSDLTTRKHSSTGPSRHRAGSPNGTLACAPKPLENSAPSSQASP